MNSSKNNEVKNAADCLNLINVLYEEVSKLNNKKNTIQKNINFQEEKINNIENTNHVIKGMKEEIEVAKKFPKVRKEINITYFITLIVGLLLSFISLSESFIPIAILFSIAASIVKQLFINSEAKEANSVNVEYIQGEIEKIKELESVPYNDEIAKLQNKNNEIIKEIKEKTNEIEDLKIKYEDYSEDNNLKAIDYTNNINDKEVANDCINESLDDKVLCMNKKRILFN